MKPQLLIMAAGMGSRYGGLKQIDPIGPNGEVIIDYSLYDAKRAGFNDVTCIIKKEIEDDFKAVMEKGASKHLNITYAYQEIGKLPEGFAVPEGRKKPWGTGHAILCAKDFMKNPFAVINADDYYGPDSFKKLYNYLENAKDTDKYDFCMVGYRIENTVTENGSVARGICEETSDNFLYKINERTRIEVHGGFIEYTEDDGASWVRIPKGTLVSMNMFGFTPAIMTELEKRFPEALTKIIKENPEKGEYLIPEVVGSLVRSGKAAVRVLESSEVWYGVTYRDDKPTVINAIRRKIDSGLYPEKLWD